MIYIFTSGEYSDFTLEGVYEGPEGLELKEALKEFLADPEQVRIQEKDNNFEWDGKSEMERFSDYLLSRYDLKSIDHKEWWVGAYGNAPELKEIKE